MHGQEVVERVTRKYKEFRNIKDPKKRQYDTYICLHASGTRQIVSKQEYIILCSATLLLFLILISLLSTSLLRPPVSPSYSSSSPPPPPSSSSSVAYSLCC